MLSFVISLAALLLVVALVLLALRLCRKSAVSRAAFAGRWRISGGCAGYVCFDRDGVGYFESGGNIETFSFRILCKRLVLEQNCCKIRYRFRFSDNDTLLLTNGRERLTLMR